MGQARGNKQVKSKYWVVVIVSVAQSCLTLCDPVDCSPPGSSIHGISQAKILEWVAISFSRGSSRRRDLKLGLLHCRQILYLLLKGAGLVCPTFLAPKKSSGDPGYLHWQQRARELRFCSPKDLVLNPLHLLKAGSGRQVNSPLILNLCVLGWKKPLPSTSKIFRF